MYFMLLILREGTHVSHDSYSCVPKMKLQQRKFKACFFIIVFVYSQQHVCPSIAIESAFIWNICALNEGNEKSLKKLNK